jgi:hypothetical protein
MPRRHVHIALALLALIALPVLTGCDSTQDKNKRAEVAAKRKLEARKPIKDATKNPVIEINEVQAVGKGKDAVVVVSLTNNGAEVLSDLPITVGVKRDGRTTLINKGPDIYYFANHVPAAAKGKETIWVGDFNRRIPKGKLFAQVGQPTFPQTKGARFPEFALKTISHSKGEVVGAFENKSGIPQYVVELYAVTRHGGKWVAAGRFRLTRVTGSGKLDFVIPMQGNAKKYTPSISAGPAILAPPE